MLFTHNVPQRGGAAAQKNVSPSPKFVIQEFHFLLNYSPKISKNAHQFFQRGRKTKIVTGLNEITQIISP